MKPKIAKLLAASLFIICGAASLGRANPFSSKIQKSSSANTCNSPVYKGYALTGEGKLAFVQCDGRQYIIQKGDKLKNLQITDIRDEYITYKLNNKLYRATLEVGGK